MQPQILSNDLSDACHMWKPRGGESCISAVLISVSCFFVPPFNGVARAAPRCLSKFEPLIHHARPLARFQA